MCEDKAQPVKLLIIRSVTELSSGKKCCAVNNGSPHAHAIKAENQRYEKVHIKGNIVTRSTKKQLTFSSAWHRHGIGCPPTSGFVDFLIG